MVNVYIKTLGCASNHADSCTIKAMLEKYSLPFLLKDYNYSQSKITLPEFPDFIISKPSR